MQIYIGPFIDRWTTQSFENFWRAKRAGVKSHWDVPDDYKETKLDDFVEKACEHWQSVLNFTVNRYYDNAERKINIQIDKYDTWSMDHTLAMITLPMLIQLQKSKHGSPLVDDKDVPKGLGLRAKEAPKVSKWETDDNIHKRWDWIMNELIWTFTQLADEDNDSQFHSGEHDMIWTPVDAEGNKVDKADAKLYQMDKGPNDTHVYDDKAHKKHQKRIARGLKLFGKYYQGLWD